MLKSKNPLLSILLSLLIPGLGHIYVGKIRRGLLFVLVFSLVIACSILFLLYPQKGGNVFLFFLPLMLMAYSVVASVDSYRLTKVNNNQLGSNETSVEKKLVVAMGVLLMVFVFNVPLLIGKYITNNVIQHFRISSDSMIPTLKQSDVYLIDKTIYNRLAPTKGDIIVFESPLSEKVLMIKRIVAVGGEHIEIKEGHVIVDGREWASSKLKDIEYQNLGPYAQAGEKVKVPFDHYFVLGDNSKKSVDSRYWGFVPRKSVLGKVYKFL